MTESLTVYVVGFTSKIYETNNSYGVKTQGVKEYIEYLDDEFSDLHLFSEQSKINGGGEVTPIEINEEYVHPQSIDSIFGFIWDYLKNSYSILSNNEGKRSASIIFLPGMFQFLISLPIVYKSDIVVLYYMSDTDKVMWTNENSFTKLKQFLYSTIDEYLMKKADQVVYRDTSVQNRTYSGDTKFERSKPIISFTDNDIYARKDTCTSDEVSISFVGSLEQRKGVNLLIKSFKKANDELEKELTLTIVGDGPNRNGLEKECKRLDIYDDVEFKGHVVEKKKLIKVYRESDIFVLPSLEEGFPRVVVEAMSQSIPVIATDVGEISKRLDDNEALIISPGDTEDITDGIKRIIQEDNYRKKLIENGRKKSKEILSNTAGNQHSSIIRQHINRW